MIRIHGNSNQETAAENVVTVGKWPIERRSMYKCIHKVVQPTFKYLPMAGTEQI
jgi:hypothetical protein